VTVSGVIYAQYAYALRRATNGAHANNFDVTRGYLNVIGRFASGVGSRITADVYRNADGSLDYRLKYGYVSYRPDGSALTFKLGMYETPFVGYNETLWDYRMQGSDPTDRAGYLSSSDFGAGVEGSWNDDAVTMSAGVYNGEFYSRAPGDQHKDLEGRLSVRLLESDEPGRYGGLRLTGFGLIGEPTRGGVRARALGQLSYRSQQVIFAVTGMTTRDRVDSTAAAPTTTGSLLSIMGVYRLPQSPFALIGRFDAHDPDTGVADNGIRRFIAGVSYQLSPELRLLVDLDHTWYQGAVPAAIDATRSLALFQIGLVF
jgi:hypothetical protein